MKTDAQLQHDVLAELGWDPAVRSADVGVTVRDGVVTLTGHLADHAQKHAVQRAVQRVRGVTAVVVEMDVRLEPALQRTDADIAASAQHALSWCVQVPGAAVRVVVERGWLTLDGQVEWDYQRRAAENAVRSLCGVVGLTNLIAVQPTVRAASVEHRIHDALARQADRESRHVSVQADGTTVTLRGAVHSWAERTAVLGAAWSTPGVSQVISELTVAP